MIEENAVITEKNDSNVIFEVERTKACGICGQTRGCGNATWGKLLGHQQHSVKAENPIDANIGDHVIVGVEEKVILNAALYLYVIPLLGLFLGAGAGQLLFKQDHWGIVGAALGLFTGFMVVKQYLSNPKNQPKNQSYAKVLRYSNESSDSLES
jgi:sigma-E factor negative regulatory protein RseC